MNSFQKEIANIPNFDPYRATSDAVLVGGTTNSNTAFFTAAGANMEQLQLAYETHWQSSN
ncbi:hypothetical protein ACHAXS_006502 [Conticribra weissflogii]